MLNIFSDCNSLENITVPESIETIGSDALYNTLWYESQPEGLVYVGKIAYKYKGSMPANTKISLKEGTKGISSSVFSNYKDLTSITIPNSVTSIGDWAFSGCSGLIFITLPDSITKICRGTFFGCSHIAGITIPDGVKTIGESAFAGCSSLSSVKIPESVSFIGSSAFANCEELADINIPIGIKTIKENTFEKCRNIENVWIPDGVISIGDNAFYWCTSLTSIRLPEGLQSIGKHVFENCSFTSIVIPEGVNSIGWGSFSGCSWLRSISFPASLRNINFSLSDCYSLTSIHISDISAWCKMKFNSENPLIKAHHLFLGDDEIKDLVIPDSVTSINKGAFIGCSGLTSVKMSDSVSFIDEKAFSGCSGLTSLTLSDSLHAIMAETFMDCSNLKELTIPASVEIIYQRAFFNCSSLESINVLSETPPFIYDNSFSNYTTTLIVPKGTKEIYQNAQGWKNFKNIKDSDVYYQVTISNAQKGIVTYEGNCLAPGESMNFNVKEGRSITLTVIPDDEFGLKLLTVNGEDFTAQVAVDGTLIIPEVSTNLEISIEYIRTKMTATIIIGESELTTYCPTEDIDFVGISGLEAYIGSGFDMETGILLMTRVYDVPSGTGLLLKGEPGTYDVPYSTSHSIYVNLLKGLTEGTILEQISEDCTNYLLSDGAQGLGFYAVNVATVLEAGKAYLPIPTVSAGSRQCIRITYGETTTTGISDMESTEFTTDTYYDMQGRKHIGKPVMRGVYMTNGRKVLVK